MAAKLTFVEEVLARQPKYTNGIDPRFGVASHWQVGKLSSSPMSAVPGNSLSAVVTRNYGVGLSTSGGQLLSSRFGSSDSITSGDITVLCYYCHDGADHGFNAGLFGNWSNIYAENRLQLVQASASLRLECFRGGSGSFVDSGYIDDGYSCLASAVIKGNTAFLYKNSDLVGSFSIGSGSLSSGQFWQVGNYYSNDSARISKTTVFMSAVIHRALDLAEISQLAMNPWQIFEPEEIPLFKPITSGVVTLAILEALHGHTGDNIAFSLDTFLSAQDASHAQSAENLTLDTSTTISLIISEAFHGLSSDVISFITGSYLQVADALHGHSAEALTLATASFLAVANALHSHAADNLTLDTSNATTLAPQDSAHAHSADNTALTLDTWLEIVEAVHANSADNVSIGSEELLYVADALHSHASDALLLSIPSAPGTCPTAAEIAAAIIAAAQITPIYSDIRKVNNLSVNGSGTDGDPWGPV